MQSLNIKAFGLTFGIFWGISVLLIGILSSIFNYGNQWFQLLSTVYPGFALNLPGIMIGTLWGFVDGLFCGVFIAWLYNRLSTACSGVKYPSKVH